MRIVLAVDFIRLGGVENELSFYSVSLPYWCWVLKDNANTTQHSMIIASMEVCFHHIKIVPNDMSFYALNRNFLTLTKVVLTLSFAINRIE